MKERVKRVLKFQKPSWVIIAAAVAAAAMLSVGFAVDRMGISAGAAIERLTDSIIYADGEIRFQIPAGYPNAENWNIHIAGRAGFGDGFSTSVHYLEEENESHAWEAGKWYTVPIEVRSLSELRMDVYLPDETGHILERSVDLLSGQTDAERRAGQ